MAIEMNCPTCSFLDISKNGTTRWSKQNYKCRDCGRQFVEAPECQPKSKNPVERVNLLLLGKIRPILPESLKLQKAGSRGMLTTPTPRLPEQNRVSPAQGQG